MPSAAVIDAYNRSRDRGTDQSVLCHAPFLSLNFDQSGRVTACCFNREYVLGTYPAQSVQEIWNGESAKALRQAFRENAIAPGCDRCFHQLDHGNFSGALMRNFDSFSTPGRGRASTTEGPPLVLEFEISNTCSLECVMCGGHWSSAIRERREKLPPIKSPYDAAFVDQIADLMPSAVAMRFLGGEPFLITRYHEMWERIRQVNPAIEISITTSAAVIPPKPRQLLEELRVNLVVSLDGMTRETYEPIRQNANFDIVMSNIADLRAYTRRQRTSMAIACCPMVHNWQELAKVVEFCEEQGMELFFNTVTYPLASSLAGLSADRLRDVARALEHGTSPTWSARNRAQWQSLVSQLQGWLRDKDEFVAKADAEADRVRSALVGVRGRARADSGRRWFDVRRWVGAPAEAEQPAPLPAGLAALERQVSPLARARAVETERRNHPDTPELLARLPPLPLQLWPDATPDLRELILAVNAWRHLAASQSLADPQQILDRIAAEDVALSRLIDRGNSARPELEHAKLLDWMVARISAASVDDATRLIEQLLQSGTLQGLSEESRAALAADLVAATRSMSVDQQTRVRRYLEALVFRTFPLAALAATGPEVATSTHTPIRDAVDLDAGLLAMELFAGVVALDAADRIKARIGYVRGAIAAGHADMILRGLQDSDLTAVFAFVSRTSDEGFAAALGAVSGGSS